MAEQTTNLRWAFAGLGPLHILELMGNHEASARDAFQAIEGGALLVDVREPWEYDQQRIPGSVLIPMNEVPDRLDEIPADRDIYVHCHSGGRSGRVADWLRGAGRPRAINVAGGIDAWAKAGLPTLCP